MSKSFALMNPSKPPNNPHENQNPVPYRIDTQPLQVGEKLNGDNYQLWATLMKRAITGRGMVSHVTGVPPPPARTDPNYTQWVQADHCVFTWLIQSLEQRLISRVSQQPTAKHVWDAMAVTYASGSDGIQVWDLHHKASTLKQGNGTLEDVWSTLQELWLGIDQRRANPMKYPEDVEIHDKWVQDQRLYQLMIAIDNKYDTIKREIIKMDPLPSVEQAYGMIRREAGNSQILQPGVAGEINTEGIGAGLAVRGRPSPSGGSRGGGRGTGNNWSRRSNNEEKSKISCFQCGRKGHTKAECFEIIGYPEWWIEKHGKPPAPSSRAPWSQGGGHAAVAAREENRGVNSESSREATQNRNVEVATNVETAKNGAAHLAASSGSVIGSWGEEMYMEEAAPGIGKLGFGKFFKTGPQTPLFFRN